VLLFAGLALVLGLAIGVASVWAHNLSTPRGSSSSVPVVAPVPSLTGAVPSGPARIEDPALAPRIIGFVDRGTEVELRWSDPSGGRALFIIVDVTQGRSANPVLQVAAGQTSALVTGLRADADYCFYVLALAGADRSGRSSTVCTGAQS
jgi:hypothetical protein